MVFRVLEIIDSTTIRITPNWKWVEVSGGVVQIVGYSQPDNEIEDFVQVKLNMLIHDKYIELKKPIEINDGVLRCSVYLNHVDITEYFPELK
ncbi:hypothetical protein [Mucilaginibacter sp. HD30]